MSHRLLVLLVVALAGALVAGACSDRAAPRFPHLVHLAGLECGTPGKPACLSCNSCHVVSEKDRAHKLPDQSLCTSCHRDDAHEALAVLDVKPARVSGPITFNHDQHLTMKGIKGQCAPCHAGVVEPDKPSLPPMAQCFSCHEHQQQWDQGVCTPCHSQLELRKTLPKTFLRHDASFAKRHGQLATQNMQLCQGCHSQAQCDDCHDMTQGLSIERRRPEQLERSFVHRGDFMVRHAIEAQSQPARCLSCHTVQSCDGCHVARGVSANRAGSRNPHPPGWVGTNTASRSFHGREARRDIVACAGCHEQGPATNCIRCHKVGAYGGNPHPNGWQSSQGTGAQMCGYCHG
ncbi:MAG: hypothetical protein KF718_16080 [Polyangiaceae bacterium]|nr:hypothetical protein [Polyangiaceae bacterium]